MNVIRTLGLTASLSGLLLAGCATSSGEIATSYSSPLLYQGYTCEQLAFEDQAVNSKATQLRGAIDHRATNDKIAMGVGVVLFWPALFFVKGDGTQAAEYAQLKGQHDAIDHAGMMKGCMNGQVASAYARPPVAALPAPPVPIPAAYQAAYQTVQVQAPSMSYEQWLAARPSQGFSSIPQDTDERTTTIRVVAPPAR